jgi:hypothetical protein
MLKKWSFIAPLLHLYARNGRPQQRARRILPLLEAHRIIFCPDHVITDDPWAIPVGHRDGHVAKPNISLE